MTIEELCELDEAKMQELLLLSDAVLQPMFSIYEPQARPLPLPEVTEAQPVKPKKEKLKDKMDKYEAKLKALGI